MCIKTPALIVGWYMCPQTANLNLTILTYNFDWVHSKVYTLFIYCSITDIIIRKIIHNYKLPNEFITNKNTTFVSQFFIILITRLKINNKLSIAFYLQTDKQIKRFN